MTWMLCTLAFSGLAALAAHLVEGAMTPAQARRHVWTAAALISLLVPAIALAAGGTWPGNFLLPDPTGILARDQTTPPLHLLSSTGDVGGASIAAADAPSSFSATHLVLATWVLLSSLVLLLYGAVWLRFVGAASEWRRARLCDQDVFVAAQLGPAVFGLRRPRIVLPEWVLAAPAAVQRVIMLHEMEHARARDHVLLGLAPLGLVLMPWNLPLWWQLHRMRLAIEVDCDARVIGHGVAVRDYGSLLIDIAGRSTPMPRALAALSEPRTLLERRILAMSTIRSPRSSLRVAASLAAAALLAVTAFETFTYMTPATHAQVPAAQGAVQPEAAAANADQRVADILTTATDTPLVVIDGVIVSSNAVRETVGEATIMDVEVVADPAKLAEYGERGRNGVIFITTSRSAVAATAPAAGRPRIVLRGESTFKGSSDGLLGTPLKAAEVRVVGRDAVIRNAGDKQPLMVVDGVPIGQHRDLPIDPARIESISIIRSAMAVSLYGARAADGVILIETKKEDADRQ